MKVNFPKFSHREEMHIHEKHCPCEMSADFCRSKKFKYYLSTLSCKETTIE